MIDRRLFRCLAVASAGAAVLVIFVQYAIGDYEAPATAAEGILLRTRDPYRASAALLLVQVFLMFLGLWGVTLKWMRESTGAILTGFLFVLFWQVLEILPRSVDLFTGSFIWAPDYLATTEEAERTAIMARFQLTAGVLAGIGHARRAFWALAHLLFGVALHRGAGAVKLIALLFYFNAARLLLRLLAEAAGWTWLRDLVVGREPFVVGMVPLFLLIGWWLWSDPETGVSATAAEGRGETLHGGEMRA